MYTQLGVGGSGLPPETHSPLTYFHRCPSTDTKSSRNEYIALGSNPVMLILRTGNIRLAKETRKFNLNLAQSDLPPILGRLAYLPFFVTIISLVSDLNRLHKSASSRVILTLPSSLVSSLFVLSVSLGLSLDIVFSAACKMWFTEKDVGCFFSSVCIVCAVSLFFCSKWPMLCVAPGTNKLSLEQMIDRTEPKWSYYSVAPSSFLISRQWIKVTPRSDMSER